MDFLKRNWKTLFYPFAILFIILFDQVLGFSPYITILKILIFSIIHAFIVHRTKYIYDSDTYRYYVILRTEYESNFVFDPIYSEATRRVLFILIYSLTLLLIIVRNNEFYGKTQLALVLCMLGIVFIIDIIYELVRMATNKTDFNKIKLPVSTYGKPETIYGSQRRYMYTMIVQKFVKFGPACINVTKAVSTGVGIVEFGYPTIFADGQLGPVTKLIANKIIYKNEGLECPIQTQQDMIYESHRKVIEEGVVDGSRAYNPMPKRTFSFCSEIERNEFLIKNRIVR